MFPIHLYASLIALLVVAAAADHSQHWSRRSHRAVARSEAVVGQVERAMTPSPNRRTAKSLGRRSCKPPSNSNPNSTALPTGSAVLAAPSASKEQTSASSTATEHTAATKSKTSTSAKATSTGGSGSSSGGGALSLDALFPLGTPGQSWTTSPESSAALPLSDDTLKPIKNMRALTHTYMAAPDGKAAMRAEYPKGSYNLADGQPGGFSFYAPGPDSLNMTTAKEMTFGYSVYFQADFDFELGGKLPGLYGGDDPETATGCSGGRRSTECFSARLMWRTNGMGEIYSYLPDYEVAGFSANKAVCTIPPYSECNPTYGASVGRGAFYFEAGKWTTVSQRVRLNDVGKANGEMELFVNGDSKITALGLILRDSALGKQRGIQMQTFFGGSKSSWGSPKTQEAYFSDFSAAIIQSL